MKFKVIEKSRFLNSEEKEALKGGGSGMYCPSEYADCTMTVFGMCSNIGASYTSGGYNLRHTCGVGSLFAIHCSRVHDTCSHLFKIKNMQK